MMVDLAKERNLAERTAAIVTRLRTSGGVLGWADVDTLRKAIAFVGTYDALDRSSNSLLAARSDVGVALAKLITTPSLRQSTEQAWSAATAWQAELARLVLT